MAEAAAAKVFVAAANRYKEQLLKGQAAVLAKKATQKKKPAAKKK